MFTLVADMTFSYRTHFLYKVIPLFDLPCMIKSNQAIEQTLKPQISLSLLPENCIIRVQVCC